MPKTKRRFRRECKRCQRMFIPEGKYTKVCDKCHEAIREFRKIRFSELRKPLNSSKL